MATQPERLAALEEFKSSHITLFYWVVGLLVIWLGFLTVQLLSMKGDIQAIKQRLADGGTHELVAGLEKASSSASVAAQMTLIKGETALARSQGKPPNQKKIAALAPAMINAAEKYPEIPETWAAMSAVATYRTASVKFPEAVSPNALPDCDTDQSKNTIYPPKYGFPQSQTVSDYGYLYQNCKLYLDRLPGHRTAFNIVPNESAPDPRIRRGGPAHIGYPAYAINVVIVWRGALSDTDILFLNTRNCMFEFEVNTVPNRAGQNLLVAALESKDPGTGTFDLRTTQNGLATTPNS